MASAELTQGRKPPLRKLDRSTLRTGESLPGALRTASGRIIIRPGRVLRDTDLELLGDHLEKGLFGGPEWPEHAFEQPRPNLSGDGTDGRRQPTDSSRTDGETTDAPDAGGLIPVDVERLEVGREVPHALFNQNGALLVPSGTRITAPLLVHLSQQGIYQARVERPRVEDSGSVARPDAPSRQSNDLDSLVIHADCRVLPPRARAGARPRLPLRTLRAEAERARATFVDAVKRAEALSDDLIRGRSASVAAATEVIGTFGEMVRLDHSLLPAIVTLKDTPGEYLFQHGMRVALLSMSVAAELAVPAERLLEIGIGALLQDVGMMQVPRALRMAPRPLSSEERAEIRRHPLHTLSFLQNMKGLNELSRLVAYQSHERSDGSGYPRHRREADIHPLARLVSVVDAYAAMISNRPHRNARSPYQAMEALLRDTRRGLFDRHAVRLLLDHLALFPIGSYVWLSDGSLAKVLRANRHRHTRPVVVPLNSDGTESDRELDLSRAADITVVQALADAGEMQLEFFRPANAP